MAPALLVCCLTSRINTLFLALVGVGRADDRPLPIYDDDALDVLMGLHAVKRLLHLRHPPMFI